MGGGSLSGGRLVGHDVGGMAVLRGALCHPPPSRESLVLPPTLSCCSSASRPRFGKRRRRNQPHLLLRTLAGRNMALRGTRIALRNLGASAG